MLTRQEIERLIYQKPSLCGIPRFIQDSPILPDVWLAFAKVFRADDTEAWPSSADEETSDDPRDALVDLLLNPHRGSNVVDLYRDIGRRLGRERRHKSAGGGDRTPQPERSKSSRDDGFSSRLTYNESFVAVRLRFDELVRVVLPLTKWWKEDVWCRKEAGKVNPSDVIAALERSEATEKRRTPCTDTAERRGKKARLSDDLLWLVRLAGRLAWEQQHAEERNAQPSIREIVTDFMKLIRNLPGPSPGSPKLWSVSLNRPVKVTISGSVVATKADAARRLFDLKCDGIRWAVIDSGIDALHPAFRNWATVADPQRSGHSSAGGQKPINTRIVATYDFTRLRSRLCVDVAGDEPGGRDFKKFEETSKLELNPDERDRAIAFQQSLKDGRMLDWAAIEPMLRISHLPNRYARPAYPHGTHVAGILAADWRRDTNPAPPGGHELCGMCPDLELYDLRVLDAMGNGNEYCTLAALQFVRWLNACKDKPVIQGVNISLWLPHEVTNFACGQTPICEECERLVGSGVIVVVSAGNEGEAQYNNMTGGTSRGYRGISITDPGNAEAVITVGATHRSEPHTYGVSYFSSRGPTGDGRCKPDLVAPGEKIVSCIPNGQVARMDGTSMAAPHVSGAAALLLARHAELMKRPAKVKEILCRTATDLGRERFFQGHGMVDVLRAIQSI